MIDVLGATFSAEYARQFSRTVPDMIVEVLNWSVKVQIPETRPRQSPPPVARSCAKPTATRTIRIAEQEIDAAIHHRAELVPGAVVAGPALIVEAQTTTLVGPGWRAIADASGALHLTREAP